MRNISTRAEFIKYCKRALGYPVLQINVTDEQINDRIDDAILLMQQYHPDASQKTYVKYQVTQDDINNRYLDMNRASGLVDITANSTGVWGHGTSFPEDAQLEGVTIKVNNETKIITSISNTTYLTVNSAFSTTANNQYVYFPQTHDFFSVTRILPIGGSSLTASYMWDLQYQIRLNELYDFTASSYIPYEITMQHLRIIQMMFVGDNEVRFNRRNNRLYIDASWGTRILPNHWIIVECYRNLSPDIYTELWNDRWLKAYTIALIQKQWGFNLSKYKEIALIGGVKMDGITIMENAEEDIKKLRKELEDMEVPPAFFVG